MRGLRGVIEILVRGCDNMVYYLPVGAEKRAAFVAIVMYFSVVPVAEQVLAEWRFEQGLSATSGTAKFGRIA